MAFVLKTNAFRDIKDVLADSMGVWSCTGTKTHYVSSRDDQVGLTDADPAVYKVERRLYQNQNAKDVKRNFTIMKGMNVIHCVQC